MKRWHVAIAMIMGVMMLTLAAGCGSAKPAAPAQSPAPTPAARPVETPKKGKVTIGYPAGPGLGHVPSLLAWDELNKQGYDVVPKFFATPELLIQAVARDEIPVGISTTFAFLQARQKGAPVVGFAQLIANEWNLVGRGKVKTLNDLEGVKLAQHSPASTGKLMADALLKAKVPNVKPQILYIQGSDNRADAMMKGTIDATTVEFPDPRPAPGQADGSDAAGLFRRNPA